jgi:hypothetical protein
MDLEEREAEAAEALGLAVVMLEKAQKNEREAREDLRAAQKAISDAHNYGVLPDEKIAPAMLMSKTEYERELRRRELHHWLP